MNPFRHVSERWFWISLYVLLALWVVYLIATDPFPRPVNPAPPEGIE